MSSVDNDQTADVIRDMQAGLANLLGRVGELEKSLKHGPMPVEWWQLLTEAKALLDYAAVHKQTLGVTTLRNSQWAFELASWNAAYSTTLKAADGGHDAGA